VTIPGTINSLPVTSIGNGAFVGKMNLTSVTIPNSVTSMGDGAFQNCSSLISATIGNGVTSIGVYAFYGCTSLNSITIPSSVTSIGNNAFAICTSLSSITIPSSVTSIGNSAFAICTSLTSVTIPNSITSMGDSTFQNCSSLISATIGNGVTSIADGVFYDCTSLTSITIPSSVTRIGVSAFERSGLSSITIPSSVTSIASSAFYMCTSLSSALFKGNAPLTGSLVFNATASGFTVYYLNGATGFSTPTWNGYPAAVFPFTYTTSNNQITITGYTGSGGAVTIPSTINSLTVIGIENSAFQSKTTVTSITIPNSVNSIGYNAFGGCINLNSIMVATPNSFYSSVNGVLFNNNQTSLIRYPAARDGSSYSIPSSVTSLETDAFNNCTKLISITIPSSVTSIGSSAFNGCTSLASAYFMGNAPSMGSDVFAHTANGFTVYYFNGAMGFTLPTWNSYPVAQFNCTSSNNQITITGYTGSGGAVTIPSTINGLPVTSIGNGAFYGKMNLTSATIPNSVTNIGSLAFYECRNLSSALFMGNAPLIGSSVFGSNASGFTVYYFNGATGFTAPTWNGYPAAVFPFTYTTSNNQITITGYTGPGGAVIIPNTINGLSVTSVASCRDYSVNPITSITIPSSVTSIGSKAFDSTSLTSVTIPSSVTSIGDGAFGHCLSLTSAVFMGNAPAIAGGWPVFWGNPSDFAVYYFNGASGFTSPTWQGYPAVNMGIILPGCPLAPLKGISLQCKSAERSKQRRGAPVDGLCSQP
jgi:hypothetical protein